MRTLLLRILLNISTPSEVHRRDVSDERIDLETGYDLGGMYDPEEMPNILTPDCRE
jgi:hypothetical protein